MNTQAATLPVFRLPFNVEAVDDFRLNFELFAALRGALSIHPKALPITTMGRSDFIHYITLHFPDVSARIEKSDFGIIHLEMGVMKLATRDAILGREFSTVRRHFSFVSYLFEHADRELYDAIVVSYLEGIFISETLPSYLSARRLLPLNLEEALKKSEHNFRIEPPSAKGD